MEPVISTDPVRLAVLTLQRAAYVTEAQAHGDLTMPPLTQTLEQLRAELSDPATQCWGIREGGRLVASVRVRLAGQGVAEVGRLVVAPDRQGHGLGSGLLRAAEAALPEDVTLIRLFTGEHSHANLRLYRRLGYTETGRSAAGNYHLVHLAKSRLPSPAPSDSRCRPCGRSRIAWFRAVVGHRYALYPAAAVPLASPACSR